MDNTKELGRYAVDTSLDELQDAYDITDALDVLVEEIMTDDNRVIWGAVGVIRDRIDQMIVRNIDVAGKIRRSVPDTHAPTVLVEAP